MSETNLRRSTRIIHCKTINETPISCQLRDKKPKQHKNRFICQRCSSTKISNQFRQSKSKLSKPKLCQDPKTNEIIMVCNSCAKLLSKFNSTTTQSSSRITIDDEEKLLREKLGEQLNLLSQQGINKTQKSLETQFAIKTLQYIADCFTKQKSLIEEKINLLKQSRDRKKEFFFINQLI